MSPAERSTSQPIGAELRGRALLLNVAFWTLFGTLQASNWLSWSGNESPRRVWGVLGGALFNAYLWALITPTIFRWASRMNTEPLRLTRSAAKAVGLGLLVAAVTTVLAVIAHVLLIPQPAPIGPQIAGVRVSALGRWYFQQIVTFGVVLVAGIASDVARRYRAREREAARLEARASELQARSAELETQLTAARLAVLRARLNPHFLFNTLNAISALIAEDPPASRDMIALLSELLRHALRETTEQVIPLREELRLLRLYLEILEIRYQGQLRTVVTVDPAVQEALVPNLLLQPLVENAMKHGIDRAGGHGTIEVVGARSGDDLVLTVRDTGPGDGGAAARTSEGGVGLRLTRERLTELYGDQQRLQLEHVDGGGMLARVFLPYHTQADMRAAAEVGSS